MELVKMVLKCYLKIFQVFRSTKMKTKGEQDLVCQFAKRLFRIWEVMFVFRVD